MIGGLRKAMMDRDIPLYLNTRLASFIEEDGRVAGVNAIQRGAEVEIRARRGVIVATGGFDKHQGLRDKYMPVTTPVDSSLTPGQTHTGDALVAPPGRIRLASSVAASAWNSPFRVPAPAIRLR